MECRFSLVNYFGTKTNGNNASTCVLLVPVHEIFATFFILLKLKQL